MFFNFQKLPNSSLQLIPAKFFTAAIQGFSKNMAEQYEQLDLQQFMARRTQFPAISHEANSPEILQNYQIQYGGMFSSSLQSFAADRNLNSGQQYEMMPTMGQQVSQIQGGQCGMVFPQRLDLCSSDSSLSKLALEIAVPGKNKSDCGGGGGAVVFGEIEEGGNCRWRRRETLTLLDIRSKMDAKFKETNQKRPLWDEVSRVMAEEHGYKRSGQKCREKLDNLYKYYKKTKEGKAGRQDGKNYRFFNQLEALFGGDTSNPAPEAQVNKNPSLLAPDIHRSPSFINKVYSSQNPYENLTTSFQTWDFDAVSSSPSSSEEQEEQEETEIEGKKRQRNSWKSELKTYMEIQIKMFMERQEAWLEKVLQTLETQEKERVSREEAWRNQESALLDREHKFWANERAWIESRDMAILEALKKLTREDTKVVTASPENNEEADHDSNNNNSNNTKKWVESEILSLIELRTGMETRFQECGSKGNMWEEISNKMGNLGYDRNASRCKEKWENINKYYWKTKNNNKKRKENSRTCPYFQHLDLLYNQP